MKETKILTISIMVLYLLILGFLRPEKAYASSDNNFIIENGILYKYNGAGGDVVIPYGVIKISDMAFNGYVNLSSVVIPDSVSSIGSEAFYDCTSLTSVLIPDSVTEIGSEAFFNTPWLDKKRIERKDHLVIINNILIDGQEAKGHIIINDDVTIIADRAFYYNLSLFIIEFPESVTTIGNNAFDSCKYLTSIMLPDSITTIGINAFGSCKNLTSVKIPDSVTSIGSDAFYGCTRLANINIPNGITSIMPRTFYNCNLTSVLIPDSVTSIGSRAFYNCTSLTSVLIPVSVTEIGSEAFIKTPWLDKKRIERKDHLVIINNILIDGQKAEGHLTINDDVTIITDRAFFYNPSLFSIELPESVTTIEENAFNYCENLISVLLPESVTTIGDNAFTSCYNLTSINLPDSITSIGSDAFSWTNLTNINLPNGITSIMPKTFYNCNLTSVLIPDSVTEIGDWAFYGCSRLKEITIPKNVKKLGEGILEECYALNKITILNKKVMLLQPNVTGSPDTSICTLFGYARIYENYKVPNRTLILCGYKYSTADEFAVLMNTLQATSKTFNLKEIKFIALDENKNTLDKIKVPTNISIMKGKSKKLAISLPATLKRVDKFTKEQQQVKITITYSIEKVTSFNFFMYDTKKISNDTIKATEKGTGYAYTTATLPNGDKKVFATKVTVK